MMKSLLIIMIKSFKEKSDNDSNWINGGFMVVNPSIYQHIKSNNDVLETDLLTVLVKRKKLYSYKHYGFWQAMDTLRDKELLEDLISRNDTPWIKVQF